jgi:microcystin-dependent protein
LAVFTDWTRFLENANTTAPPIGNFTNQAPNTPLHAQSAGNTGGGQSVEIRQPVLAVNYIIALQGVYPSRS